MNCRCGGKHLFENCLETARVADRFHIVRPDGRGFSCQHCCQRFTVASLQVANALLIEQLQRQIEDLEAQLYRPVPLLLLYEPYIWS